jgi:hypothetical protein
MKGKFLLIAILISSISILHSSCGHKQKEIRFFDWFCSNLLGISKNEIIETLGKPSTCDDCDDISGTMVFKDLITSKLGTSEHLVIRYENEHVTLVQMGYAGMRCE